MSAQSISLLSTAQQMQYSHLIYQLRKGIQETHTLTNGFAVRLPVALLSLAASLMALEHRCHPFFNLHLDVTADDHLWLTITVPEGTQVEPLREAFPALL
jgi:hypothetical protein